MKGSIRERSPGVFELRVFLGTDAVTGKKRINSVTFRGTRRDAETKLAALVTDSQSRRISGKAAPGTYTLNQLIEAVLDDFQGSPSTLVANRYQHQHYIAETIGRQVIGKIDARLLGQFYNYLGERRGLAPGTIRRVHAIISSALRQAVRWGWLPRNPAADAAVPKIPKRDSTVPARVDVHRAFEVATEHEVEFGVFVRLAASTGARRGELCALRWDAVDLDAGVVKIVANIVKVDGGVTRKDPKNHMKRDVPIEGATIDALRKHRRAMDERAEACGVRLGAEAHLFSYSADCADPWHPDTVTHKWERVRDEVGMPTARLHDLRYFQATMLLAAGVPVPNVSKRIGHRDSATTLNVYAHALEELDRHSADVMGRILQADPAPPTT